MDDDCTTDGEETPIPLGLDQALGHLFSAAYLLPTRGQRFALAAMIDYFGADDTDDLQAAFTTLRRSFGEFVATQIHEPRAVMTQVRVNHTDGTKDDAWFETVPTPPALLFLAAMHADVGDEVVLIQHWACRPPWNAHATWPFDLEAAEAMTRPPVFNEEDLDDDEVLMSHVIDLGAAGELVGSCDASDPVWKLPHFRATSGEVEGRRYVGLGFGWRDHYRQLTWMARER